MDHREWNTPIRKRWNPVIKEALHGVDNHSLLYLATGDKWHLKQATLLRGYVRELKDWITQEEAVQAVSHLPTCLPFP